jgi:hypothetical protein
MEYNEFSTLNSGIQYTVHIDSLLEFFISKIEKSPLVEVSTILGNLGTHNELSFPCSISIVFGPYGAMCPDNKHSSTT